MERGRRLKRGERERARMELFNHYLQVGCHFYSGVLFAERVNFSNTVRDISIKTV
jgi:hypothetical protein